MVLNIRTISKYFIEFLIVAFGVYLGVYAGEKQSEKKTYEKKEKSLTFIIEELENNKAKLDSAYAYHQSIELEFDANRNKVKESDYLKPYIGNTVFKHTEIKGWKGLGYANLNDTAFEAAKISGIIQEFDFETVQAISEVYNYQKEYADFANSLLQKILNFDSSTTVVDIMSVIDQMGSDLKNFEFTLKESISNLVSQLKSEENKESINSSK